ncbi:sensor histidine kinase RegB [Pseudoroseicyclus sp. CXY001]|uniref:sensor histidine kinase RegB n=1 Tax=Pseudoroseicyclus sp. CXY001 TaxID=3242492 RepID=UPI00357145E2
MPDMVAEPIAAPLAANGPAAGPKTDYTAGPFAVRAGAEALGLRTSRAMRLKTMLLLRWVAIVGQIAGVLVACLGWGLQIDLPMVGLAIGASVMLNFACLALYDSGHMLTEHEAGGMIAFDMLQLGALLYLTGGLINPFALLLLPPITIAATALRLRVTLPLGALTVFVLTALLLWNRPIITADGSVFALPQSWIVGFWLALVIGSIFLSLYAHRVTAEMAELSEALSATQLALAREQKLTDLGGVVAATAHELGTPLATIKLAAAELADDLTERPTLAADAQLIADSADRCRDILRAMGRAGNEDMQVRNAPVMTVIRESAEPHMARGKTVTFTSPRSPGRDQPRIWRRPEVIHGLRNLIQNAVDFAATEVRIETRWTALEISVTISDDGRGFSPGVLARIGEPMQRRRRTADEAPRQPGYDGLGLGLFIAKTLLERSGARLSFGNGHGAADGLQGAVVTVTWPRSQIEAPASGPLGPNLPLAS